MSAIPESYQDLLHSKALAMLATTGADGAPQVTPVWFDWDGEHIVFSTARGRQKDRNIGRQPRVAVAIVDPANIYRYIQIRGVIASAKDASDSSDIDRLATKYTGAPYKWAKPGEQRVTYKVKPEAVQAMG